jgi:hypothetical protein
MAGEDDTAADGDAWALAWVHMTLQVLGTKIRELVAHLALESEETLVGSGS